MGDIVKSNKGVTLIILVIYIILLTIVVGFLSLISSNFYTNVKYIQDQGKYIAEFNKFNMYFIEDVKNNSNIYTLKDNRIVFEDGTEYIYKSSPDKGIYRNDVKICRNVEYCSFSKSEIQQNNTDKIIITVKMIIDSSELFETSTDYVLRYW